MQVNFNISLKEIVSWENINYKMYLRRDSKPQQILTVEEFETIKKVLFSRPRPKGTHSDIFMDE